MFEPVDPTLVGAVFAGFSTLIICVPLLSRGSLSVPIASRWIALLDCVLVPTFAIYELLTNPSGGFTVSWYAGFCIYDLAVRLLVREMRSWDYLLHHIFVLGTALHSDALVTEACIWLYGDGLAWVTILLRHHNVRNKTLNKTISVTRTIWYWARFFWGASITYRAHTCGTQHPLTTWSGTLVTVLTLVWAVIRTMHKIFPRKGKEDHDD